MGGASVVDYLISDPNALRNSISNIFISNNQPDLDHCPFFFKIGNSVGSRIPAMFSQGQVLRPNTKKANHYVFNIKHELTSICARRSETYTSLEDHTQTWLHLTLRTTQPIFSKIN
jgi:hypothetical protein